jgi:hypothetical protein
MATPTQELALALLLSIAETEEKMAAIQLAIQGVWSQSDMFPMIPEGIETKAIELIDEILGDTIASYWLYDCRRNGGITESGVTWPITSIDDIRAWLDRKKSK